MANGIASTTTNKLNDLLGTMPNKSLDASGTSGLVIDNLSVTWLTAAASTQPFGGSAMETIRLCALEEPLCST